MGKKLHDRCFNVNGQVGGFPLTVAQIKLLAAHIPKGHIAIEIDRNFA